MEQQNGTVMKMVLRKTDSSSVISENNDVIDPRDVAAKFFWDNRDILESIVKREKDRIAQEEAQKLTIMRNPEEAETLVQEFLTRRILCPCELMFFKLRACSKEPTIYLFMNAEQVTIAHTYFNEIRKYFNREWLDPEYGLLETRRKIQKRICALYGIEHICPSKSTPSFKMQPTSTNGNPKLYHYINIIGSYKYLMNFDFTPFMPWEDSTKLKDNRNFLARSIIKEIEDDVDKGNAVIMGISEYIRGLSKDMVDFMELEKWMSVKDKIVHWKSHRLMEFFLKTYDNTMALLDK